MANVIETSAWLAQHEPHLQSAVNEFLGWLASNVGADVDPRMAVFDFPHEDAGHPSGELVVLVCPCGARHTTFEPGGPKAGTDG